MHRLNWVPAYAGTRITPGQASTSTTAPATLARHPPAARAHHPDLAPPRGYARPCPTGRPWRHSPPPASPAPAPCATARQVGGASCRERVGGDVELAVVAVAVKKQTKKV